MAHSLSRGVGELIMAVQFSIEYTQIRKHLTVQRERVRALFCYTNEMWLFFSGDSYNEYWQLAFQAQKNRTLPSLRSRAISLYYKG